MNNSISNIMLITCSAGKYSDSQTIRIRNYLIALLEFGIKVELIVPDGSPDDLPEHPNVRRHVVGPPPYLAPIALMQKTPFIGNRLVWLYKNVIYRCLLPDAFRGWSKIVKRYVSGNRFFSNIDVIISSAGSPEAHIAASHLTNIAPWVADFGDPWHFIDKQTRPMFAPAAKKIERNAIEKCAGLIFTTYATADLYKRWLNSEIQVPIEVIPYGYVGSDFCFSDQPENFFSVAHIGTAHRSDRDLTSLIHTVGRHAGSINGLPIRLVLAGRRSPYFDEEIKKFSQDRFQCHDTVSYRRSIEMLMQSSVAVVIGNKNGTQVPGKVFTLMATGKPIIYVSQCPIDDDEALSFLKEAPIEICINTEDSIAQAIANAAAIHSKSKSSKILAFESKTLASKLLGLCNKSIHGH